MPGGRAGLIRDHGYYFDTGPTVLTMPELVAAAARRGRREPDRLADPAPARSRPTAPASPTAARIDVRADVDAMADEIAATCGRPTPPATAASSRYLRELYALEMPHFIDRNLDSPLQLLGLPLAAAGARWAGSAGSDTKVGAVLRRRAAAPAVLVPGDVRRARTARRRWRSTR